METRQFVIFDNSSGQILATHTHVSVEGPAGAPGLDELRAAFRAFGDQDADPSTLDILDVDVDLLRRGVSSARAVVDPATRQIVWPENGASSAS